MISQRNSENQIDHSTCLTFSVSGPPSLAAHPYNGDTSREQTASQGKTQGESLTRIASQIKIRKRMTSYSKAELKDLESIEWSQTRNGRADEIQGQWNVVLLGKQRWGGGCLRSWLQNKPNDSNILLELKG